MIKAIEKKSLTQILRCNILDPRNTFSMHSITLLCITFGKTMLFCIQAVFITFFITILNGFFFYICNNEIVNIGLRTCINYIQWKNEYMYHNNQGTIDIHCKGWLFYIIPNLCYYNKLKIPCLGILSKKKNTIIFVLKFFDVLLRQVMQLQWMFHSLFMSNNELRLFKLNLYTNYLLATWSFFTSSRAKEINNHKNDDVKNGYDCIEHFYIIRSWNILWLLFD